MNVTNLIEAFLLFDKVEAENHQCKNAYICQKHPELELNWEFLETVRLKRNAINYRGHLMNYDGWSKLQLQFELNINHLVKKIEEILER